MPRKPPRPQVCEICGREKPLTFHHLIPRAKHGKRVIRERFERPDLKARGIWVCHLCHRQIHRFFDNRRLAEELNTVERLRETPEMLRYIAWARKLN